ncbi:phosphoenolpyruvate-utilizing N-terminal domain-containing protein [Shigella sonnei]
MHKETAAIFDLYSHLLSDTRLRRELFAEVDKGSVAEWAVKTVIEKFAEQFAALSDNYLKSGLAIYVRWVSDCCFILMTLIKGRTPGRNVSFWWQMNCQRQRLLSCPGSLSRCRRARWRCQLPCCDHGTCAGRSHP